MVRLWQGGWRKWQNPCKDNNCAGAGHDHRLAATAYSLAVPDNMLVPACNSMGVDPHKESAPPGHVRLCSRPLTYRQS